MLGAQALNQVLLFHLILPNKIDLINRIKRWRARKVERQASDRNLNWTLPFKCLYLRSLRHFRFPSGWGMGGRGVRAWSQQLC